MYTPQLFFLHIRCYYEFMYDVMGEQECSKKVMPANLESKQEKRNLPKNEKFHLFIRRKAFFREHI